MAKPRQVTESFNEVQCLGPVGDQHDPILGMAANSCHPRCVPPKKHEKTTCEMEKLCRGYNLVSG